MPQPRAAQSQKLPPATLRSSTYQRGKRILSRIFTTYQDEIVLIVAFDKVSQCSVVGEYSSLLASLVDSSALANLIGPQHTLGGIVPHLLSCFHIDNELEIDSPLYGRSAGLTVPECRCSYRRARLFKPRGTALCAHHPAAWECLVPGGSPEQYLAHRPHVDGFGSAGANNYLPGRLIPHATMVLTPRFAARSETLIMNYFKQVSRTLCPDSSGRKRNQTSPSKRLLNIPVKCEERQKILAKRSALRIDLPLSFYVSLHYTTKYVPNAFDVISRS